MWDSNIHSGTFYYDYSQTGNNFNDHDMFKW